MKRNAASILVVLCFIGSLVGAEDMTSHGNHHGMHHALTESGMVMNENMDVLPRDCKELGADVEFNVTAGTAFARRFPGTIFGLSDHEYEVPPCSRVTVTFTNEDQVRHQWMVHGLPRYLYPGGMFHIEAEGGATLTGTFIVPADKRTYLVHCDVAQHMEKGMKGQLKVNGGDGDLWSVPGVARSYVEDNYAGELLVLVVIALLAGVVVTVAVAGSR